MILSYLGSKQTLLPHLDAVIKPLLDKNTRFCDVFAGSGCVSNHYKHIVGSVVASDLELYSYVLNRALLKCPFSKKLAMIIDQFNMVQGFRSRSSRNLVYHHFASNGRLYFTPQSALKIDMIRRALNKMHQNGTISYSEFVFLLASLLTSSSRYANTCGTFRAHLKSISKRANRLIQITPIHTDLRISSSSYNVVKRKDAVQVCNMPLPVQVAVSGTLKTIVYIDPPYNNVHYGAYYSFLNYLCEYNPRHKLNGTGILPAYNKSRFGLVRQALKEFNLLFSSRLVRSARYIIMSYSSKAIIALSHITDMLAMRGSIIVYKVWHKTYQPGSGSGARARRHVTEYIIKVDCNGQVGLPPRFCWLKLG
jgi:adenine-specific DNA-methyltransferase